MLGVLHSVFAAGAFHQLGNGRVIDVADPGEQVMFDLEIEGSHQPCHRPVVAGIVDRGLHLMDGPRFFDAAGVGSRHGEFRLFHDMHHLKHHAEREAQHSRHHPVAKQHHPNRMDPHGNRERQGEKDRLAPEEKHHFPALGPRNPECPDPAGEGIAKIVIEQPLEGEETV